MALYDELALPYSEMIQVDPVKVYVQRPAVIKLLGSVKNKRVLDVGCGDGTISQLVAGKGARVLGYDNSPEQIKLAKSKNSFPQVEYFISNPASFSSSKKFDAAFAVMVLVYSKNIAEFQAFFDSTFAALKKGGKFVLVDLDVSRIKFGVNQCDRIFSRLSNGKVKVDFVVPGTKPFSANFVLFSKKQFADCAIKAGFKSVSWKKLLPNAEGRKLVPKDYWVRFNADSFWMAAVFKK